MVCLDGFLLSHTTSQVSIPKQESIDQFLPEFDPLIMLDPKHPFSHGTMTNAAYITNIRKSIMDGMNNARYIIPKVFKEYKEQNPAAE